MSSSPSKEASPFLEGLVLVSVLFVIMIFPFDLCSVGIIFRTKRLRNERGHSVDVAVPISAKVGHAGHIGSGSARMAKGVFEADQLSALLFDGLLSHSQRLFYQLGCDRKSVGLGDRFLDLACIIPVGRVA
jgi:hypothetical protein